MYKRILIFLLALLIVCFNVYAHQGRTDGAGGHYNRSTGEYHYHHGESAHQHPNGICPYDESENDNYYILPDEEENDEPLTIDEYQEKMGIEETEKKEEEQKEETEEINRYIRIYTTIGFFVILINLRTGFKEFIRDEFKRKKFQGLLFLLLFVSAIALCCWVLYIFSFHISKALFKDDVVLTHICANTPTFFTIYYVVKGFKEREQS